MVKGVCLFERGDMCVCVVKGVCLFERRNVCVWLRVCVCLKERKPLEVRHYGKQVGRKVAKSLKTRYRNDQISFLSIFLWSVFAEPQIRKDSPPTFHPTCIYNKNILNDYRSISSSQSSAFSSFVSQFSISAPFSTM